MIKITKWARVAFFPLLVCVISSMATVAEAGVFWTIKINGIITTSTGRVDIDLGGYTPTGPNPAGTSWVACPSNIVRLATNASGAAVNEKYVDRMLSVALSAYKTNANVRLNIERDGAGNCSSTQVFDQGV